MTEFLVRRFVKNYEHTEDLQVRTSYGVLSSVVGIFCNVLLFAVKMLIGFTLGSISVMADAWNNLSDAASSVISYVGVKMAQKPADEEHPFGHGRVEYIAAFVVSFLILEVGLSFLKTSVDKLMHPQGIVFEWVPFLILLFSVAVKFWMSHFNRKLGNRIQSQVMLATAADSMGDVITTSATLLSLWIYGMFSVNIDAVAGLFVSVVVMWAGIGIAKDTLKPLIGEAGDPKLAQRIQQEVESYEGIVGTHDLIVHNYGPNRSMATIHAEVPCDVDIAKCHELIDRIEREVSRNQGIILVIHTDPIEVNDERVLEVKGKVEAVLQDLDEQLTFHDFRMVWGEKQSNLIFDVVVPFSYTEEMVEELKKEIRQRLLKEDASYACIITIEHGYVAG